MNLPSRTTSIVSMSLDLFNPLMWPGKRSPWVSRGGLLGLGSATKQRGGGRLKKEDLWDPQEMRTRGQGRLQWVLWYRAEDETGELNLREQREEVCWQPTWFYGRHACGLTGGA